MRSLAKIASDPSVLDGEIVRAVHERDQMFSGDEDHYFGCGRDAIGKIAGLLVTAGAQSPQRILDFACGCGRVARYLRAAFPNAELAVSDLMEHGVSFCAEHFGATIAECSVDPAALTFPQPFSLIWCGSLITHLDEAKARLVLELFARSLEPGGMAIFTTHGRYVANKATEKSWPYNLERPEMEALAGTFWQGRYGYSDYPHMKGYGISMSPFAWVMDEVADLFEIRVAGFIERGWDNHQDIVALIRKPV